MARRLAGRGHFAAVDAGDLVWLTPVQRGRPWNSYGALGIAASPLSEWKHFWNFDDGDGVCAPTMMHSVVRTKIRSQCKVAPSPSGMLVHISIRVQMIASRLWSGCSCRRWFAFIQCCSVSDMFAAAKAREHKRGGAVMSRRHLSQGDKGCTSHHGARGGTGRYRASARALVRRQYVLASGWYPSIPTMPGRQVGRMEGVDRQWLHPTCNQAANQSRDEPVCARARLPSRLLTYLTYLACFHPKSRPSSSYLRPFTLSF